MQWDFLNGTIKFCFIVICSKDFKIFRVCIGIFFSQKTHMLLFSPCTARKVCLSARWHHNFTCLKLQHSKMSTDVPSSGDSHIQRLCIITVLNSCLCKFLTQYALLFYVTNQSSDDHKNAHNFLGRMAVSHRQFINHHAQSNTNTHQDRTSAMI